MTPGTGSNQTKDHKVRRKENGYCTLGQGGYTGNELTP